MKQKSSPELSRRIKYIYIKLRVIFRILFNRHFISFHFKFSGKNKPTYVQSYNSGYLSSNQQGFLLSEVIYLLNASAKVHREGDKVESIVNEAKEILTNSSPPLRGGREGF